ncbi:TonB-dependent receptor [Rhodohalobacter sp.]|uniref:TonB-dependent receptor n=1 Tax=Rhodohalobacter sp. TaxID=1974210 RepID=UPI002ACDB83B|nr:TonB-dependent receptor [Rhodohalobacter sp.]MDZ7757042.1 TonB-dependent receptor [Rhodohalobacter sp.]
MRNLFNTVILFLALTMTAAGQSKSSGSVAGFVIDSETEEPIPFAYIHLEEINRTGTTDRHGYFKIHNVPEGEYSLYVHRIGYSSKTQRLLIELGEETNITIELNSTVLTGQSIEVVADADNLRGSNLEHASIKVTGSQLRRNLGTTLSETLSGQPGFDQRTMGAAPARPVIRGLGDERVLILQDGERTGDVSGASPDHSVTVDPMGADEIEIARGPAALAYGSNAIGGVINVVRNQIANNKPSSTNGTATVQGASVNTGISAAGMVSIPKNDFVFNVDVNGRYGDNYRSPQGSIDNSGYLTTNNAIGVSYIRPWGYSGLAASTFISNYGIPPDPEGGHANGVDVEMQKYQIESRSEYLLDHDFFKMLEGGLSYRYYHHREFESAEIIGTEYTQNSANFNLKAIHRDLWIFNDGKVGIWGEFQDYQVLDRFNINANSYSASAYTIQEADFGALHIEVGARFDAVLTKPDRDNPDSRIGNIRQRDFYSLASSATAIYNLGAGFSIGSTILHSFRAPSIEELYSQGPHIAAYSFEIGNPDLDPERGLGKELFVRYRRANANFELTGYHNGFDNYIYPRNTGRQNIFFPRLNDYQYESVAAEIYGLEGMIEFQLSSTLSFNSSASLTVGRRDVSDEEMETGNFDSDTTPLPMIPPFSFKTGLNYAKGPFQIGVNMRHSLKQDRLAEFESPTDSYTLLGGNAEYRLTTSNGYLHTFSIQANNILDETYRNHLSRLKDVFPEPGRNFSLLYRLYF